MTMKIQNIDACMVYRVYVCVELYIMKLIYNLVFTIRFSC